MRGFLPLLALLSLLGFSNKVFAQTSYYEDFSGELDEAVWESGNGYTHSIVDEVLNVNVDTRDPAQFFTIDFWDSPLDVSGNPVINFKVKASTAIMIKLHINLVRIYGVDIILPKSDDFVPVSIDLSQVSELHDLTQLKKIDFFVNINTISWNGLVEIDDFKIAGDAVRHAYIGGIQSPTVYAGEKNRELVFKGIKNAESLSVSGASGYIENLKISPIIESTFANIAYVNFDVKEGVAGVDALEVTAIGKEGFEDNTLTIPLTVVNNLPPEIDTPENIEVKTGEMVYVDLSGISDGDLNDDQNLEISAVSSDQSVIADDDINLMYKNGSPYGKLSFSSLMAGTAEITINLDDGESTANTNSATFTVDVFDNLNLPPTIDPVGNQLPYLEGTEVTIPLTSISDGNGGSQSLNFSAVSSDQTVVEDASISVTDYDEGTGTAILRYTPLAEGTTYLTLTLSDDATGTDNGAKETTIEIQVKPVVLYVKGHDWALTKDPDRWGGDSGIEIELVQFDGGDALKVTCDNKWIWGALNFSFSDTSLNLTEHPYVSMDIYSEDVRTLHWLWFYDDWELTHDDAHRNDFPNVTSASGKARWAEANQWTSIYFDYSGKNEMSRKENDVAIPINDKRIVRILYNYHDQESSWPRPPEFTGTFYIRNFKIGNVAIVPDPFTTINPVADQVLFENSGAQSFMVSGLSDGRDGLPDVSIESLSPGFANPTISAVQSDGTAQVDFTPAAGPGEAKVVITVTAASSQTTRDTFLIKAVAKDPLNASGVVVDLSRTFQTWHGMGTYMNQYFDLYTQEMGATAMRVGIISNQIEHNNDNSDPYVLNRAGLDYSAFDWDAMRKMKEMGVETFILTSWSAPGWMKDNHDESWANAAVVKWEVAPNRTSPFYYEEWAEYFVAAYRMFEEEAGIQLAGIGIQNEPAFYEPYPSAILSPAEFAKAIAVVGKRFLKEGLGHVKLYMPEQVFSQSNYSMSEYMDALHANPDADRFCEVIATHGYASDGIGSGTPNFAAWTNMYNKAQEGIGPKELWMTETHRGYGDYDDAMWIAMAIYGAMEFGNISLWTQWSITGQHIIDGQPTQMLYALANYSRFIKPGAVRVSSTSSHQDLFTTSWVDEANGHLATVAINDSDLPISAYLSGEGMPGNYKMYLTTSIRKTEYMGMTGDSLFVVPPHSILTLVAEGNMAPTIDQMSHQMVNYNASQQVLTLTGIDPVETDQSIVNIDVVSDNQTLLPDPVAGTLQPDGTVSLTFQPATDQSGQAMVTVTVTDDGSAFPANSTRMEFMVSVYGEYNNEPVVHRVPDQYLMEDQTDPQTLAIAVNDGDDGTQTITGVIENDNPAIFANLSFNNTTQEVEYTLVPELYGEANIRLTLSDDGGTANNNGDQSTVAEFKVVVASVNDEPVIDQQEDLQIGLNAPQQTVTLSGIGQGDVFGADQTLTVIAETDDLSKISPPIVSYTGGATAELTFTPIRNQLGTLNIMVYVMDNGGILNGGSDMTSMTFSVEIVPSDINEAPSMTPIEDMTIQLTEGDVTINLEGVDDGNENKEQTVSVTASSSMESVVAPPTVNWIPNLAIGSIKLKPLAVGESTITITLKDDGGTNYGGVDTRIYTFVVTVMDNVNVEDEAAGRISVYPNPVVGELRISIPAEVRSYEIHLTDLSGKYLNINKVFSGNGEYTMDLSSLQSGMYILRVSSDDVQYKTIVIKE